MKAGSLLLSRSFSKRRVSDDASNLKFDIPKAIRKVKENNRNKFFLECSVIRDIKFIFYYLKGSDSGDLQISFYHHQIFH